VRESGWLEFNDVNVLRTPEEYGVCEFADETRKVSLVAGGVIKRLLYELLGRHPARLFRYTVAVTDVASEALARKRGAELGVEVRLLRMEG